MDEHKPLKYSEYRPTAGTLDIALWEPTSFYGKLIARGTEGPFSHASCVIWLEQRLFNLEYLEGEGGKISTLRGCVERNPGTISIFRIRESIFGIALAKLQTGDTPLLPGEDPPIDIDDMKRKMKTYLLNILDARYSWKAIRLIAISKLAGLRVITWLPFLRKWYKNQIQKASASTREGICSEYVARVLGQYGVIVSHKPYASITPNDLGHAMHDTVMGEYIGTLYLDPEP